MKLKTCFVLVTAAAAAMPLIAKADVHPAGLFVDGMVIQRDTQAPVWGTASAGEEVTVTGGWGASASTTADSNGLWSVKLQTPEAGGPHTLTIKGDNTVQITDVLSGEVWLCSGQSNMDFSLQQLTKTSKRTEAADVALAAYIKNEIQTAQDDLLRQFTVEKNTSMLTPVHTLKGGWMNSSPKTNAEFSATAYFFGRELRSKLGVPVGLIECAWGGTRVEPWIPADVYERDPEMAAYYAENIAPVKKKMSTWDPQKVEAAYQAAVKKWSATKKGRKPRKPTAPDKNQQLPGTLFNGMVSPVVPYAIQGAIWYQGESNATHNTDKYETHFKAMIRGWREHWGQGDFSFYFAQLASFKAPASEPVDQDGWASVCDQQRRTLGLERTGMAVLTDIGEAKDIHPHNKMDVGKRLALWALKHDYQQDLPAWSGPLYRSHAIQDSKVTLTFDHAGSGLMTGTKTGMDAVVPTEAPLQGFQICGADRKWVWAQAEITGANTIAAWHPDIKEPAVVRYAWAANPANANLYNKEGLPASLFTTEAELPAFTPPGRAGRRSAARQ